MKLTQIALAAALALAPALMSAQPIHTFNHPVAQHSFDRGARFDRGGRGFDRGGRSDHDGRFDRGGRGVDRGGRFDRGYQGPGRNDHGRFAGPSRGWTKR